MENFKKKSPMLIQLDLMRRHGIPVIGYIMDNYEDILNEINFIVSVKTEEELN